MSIYESLYWIIISTIITSWKKNGKSSGVAPVASVAFTALGCDRPAVGTPAAAKHCSLGGGQHSHVWGLCFVYFCWFFLFFVPLLHLFMQFISIYAICALALFVFYVCFLMISAFPFALAMNCLLHQSEARFFLLSSKCNRFITVRLRQGLRERRLHGSIQGWHLWATSSASRQRLSNPEIFRCQQLFG